MRLLLSFVVALRGVAAWPQPDTTISNGSEIVDGGDFNSTGNSSALSSPDEPIIPKDLKVSTVHSMPLIWKHEYMIELVAAIYTITLKDLTSIVDPYLDFVSRPGRQSMIAYRNRSGRTTLGQLAGGLYYILQWIQAGKPCYDTTFELTERGASLGIGHIMRRSDVPTSDSNSDSDSDSLESGNTTTTGVPFNETINGSELVANETLSSSSLFSNDTTTLTERVANLEFTLLPITPLTELSTYPYIELIGRTILTLAYLHQGLPMSPTSTYISFTKKIHISVIADSGSGFLGLRPYEARAALFYLASQATTNRNYKSTGVSIERIEGHQKRILGLIRIEAFDGINAETSITNDTTVVPAVSGPINRVPLQTGVVATS